MYEKNSRWKTRREKLLELLEDIKEINDLKALVKELDYPNKSILIKDIAHIAKTLINQGKKIYVAPSSCGLCGYIFTQKGFELKIPSKCPKCKSEKIIWPSIKIEKKS
ncbi:MAG: transcriptional regulator [Candidatus Lokiarchaeota archaeon]|nr:transcriptional regulator [Candidatus Lokiarchaeota archaeon]